MSLGEPPRKSAPFVAQVRNLELVDAPGRSMNKIETRVNNNTKVLAQSSSKPSMNSNSHNFKDNINAMNARAAAAAGTKVQQPAQPGHGPSLGSAQGHVQNSGHGAAQGHGQNSGHGQGPPQAGHGQGPRVQSQLVQTQGKVEPTGDTQSAWMELQQHLAKKLLTNIDENQPMRPTPNNSVHSVKRDQDPNAQRSRNHHTNSYSPSSNFPEPPEVNESWTPPLYGCFTDFLDQDFFDILARLGARAAKRVVHGAAKETFTVLHKNVGNVQERVTRMVTNTVVNALTGQNGGRQIGNASAGAGVPISNIQVVD